MAFALSKIAKFVNKNALVTPMSSVMSSKQCKLMNFTNFPMFFPGVPFFHKCIGNERR